MILAILLYGFGALARDRERHLKRALSILLLVPLLILVLGVVDNGISQHPLAARSRRRGADVRAALGGRAGAMADPAYVSVSADRACGSSPPHEYLETSKSARQPHDTALS